MSEKSSKSVIKAGKESKVYNIDTLVQKNVNEKELEKKVKEIVNKETRCNISDEDLRKAELKYFEYLEKQCAFNLEGMIKPRKILERKIAFEDVFVPVRFAIIPKNREEVKEEDLCYKYVQAHQFWFGTNCPIPDEDSEKGEPFRAIIFSGPGGGKTTFMRRIASAYGLNAISNTTDSLPKRELFPIWIKCRDFKDIDNLSILQLINRVAVRAEFSSDLSSAFEKLALDYINNGKAVILIDGLDEITEDTKRKSFIKQLKIFADAYKKVNILMTSRLVGFKEITEECFSDFRHWAIVPFNRNEIRDCCERWHMILYSNKNEAKRIADNLSNTIIKHKRIYDMARTPLLLTILLMVNENNGGRLPQRRAELYEKAIEVLLTWGSREPMDIRITRPYLAYLAHNMIFNDGATYKITSNRLFNLLMNARKHMEQFPMTNCYNFIDEVEERSSLIVKEGIDIGSGYVFQHPQFQEYLAAYAITHGYYPDAQRSDSIVDWFRGKWENPSLKEVILLTCAIGGKWVAQDLIYAIIEHLEAVKNCRSKKRQETIKYLKNLLLQIVADDSILEPKDYEKIYQVCFSGPVNANIFKEEFHTIYMKSEYNELLKKTMEAIDKERESPLYVPMFKLFEAIRSKQDYNSFSPYIYYEKVKREKDMDNLCESIRIIDLGYWLGMISVMPSQKLEFKKELLDYCMKDNHKLVCCAYRALFNFLEKEDEDLNGMLLKSVTRFFPNKFVYYNMWKYPINEDTLIFLKDNRLNEEQVKVLDEIMKNEMATEMLCDQLLFGAFTGAWDVKTVIRKALEFHSAEYFNEKKSHELHGKISRYLIVVKENSSLSYEENKMLDEYLGYMKKEN